MMRDDDRADLPRRFAFIGLAVAAMSALILAADSWTAERARLAAASPAPAVALAATAPIDAEAGVFRTRTIEATSTGDADRRPTAHPRTLSTFRALRPYPGAPPRVPHGLSTEEIRASRCNTCHERGGYVPRFASYAPLTPHPELTACLQCHALDDALVGVALPDGSPDAICRQCHDPARGTRSPAAAADRPWWPAAPAAANGLPPAIPHDLDLRGNCLACHMGPGAVEEIRTTHPERTDCRQCHVSAGPVSEPFVRPAAAAVTGGGGR